MAKLRRRKVLIDTQSIYTTTRIRNRKPWRLTNYIRILNRQLQINVNGRYKQAS